MKGKKTGMLKVHPTSDFHQPFFSGGRSPGCERLDSDGLSVFDGRQPPKHEPQVPLMEVRRTDADSAKVLSPHKTQMAEETDVRTFSSEFSSSNAAPIAPRNRRIRVDLSFNDEMPSYRTRARNLLLNLWRSIRMIRLFLALAWTDIKTRTCSYCLGFFSVFLVVLLCVVMISLLVNTPIIFLRLSEASRGQYDLEVRPGGIMNDATGINYSIIRNTFLPSDSDYGRHAPRVLGNYRLTTLKSCLNKTADTIWFSPNGTLCPNMPSCMQECDVYGSTSARLYAIDIEAEKEMGFGADFDAPTPAQGEVIISRRAALLIGVVDVGEVVVLSGNTRGVMWQCYKRLPRYISWETMIILRVIAIVEKDEHKFPGANTFMVLSYNTMLADVASGLSPATPRPLVKALAEVNIDVCASAAYFIMNPASRLKAYGSTDYNTIRRNVVAWASGIIAPLGFLQTDLTAPQLGGLYATRMFSVFLGLIMSVVLLALAFLSIVLIYTLLTVGIETKTYELGIQRMIGLTKENLIVLVLTQAYTFAVPAWVLGLAAGQGFYSVVRLFFVRSVNVELPQSITGASVGWATLAGLGIPIVASFFPIASLLTQKLPDALNTSRGRNTAIVYKIERGESASLSGPMLGLGALLFVFGFLVYYLFPTALIAFNLSVIFYIFFGVLIGLLAGFVLLATNFERVAQTSVSYALLYLWESKAVFCFMQKSLGAHRMRNRKTTLMYAISLAFVIFITVAVQIQLISFEYQTRQSLGCDVVIDTDGLTLEEYGPVDEVLAQYEEDGTITAYTYDYTFPELDSLDSSILYSLGRYRSSTATIFPLPPKYFEAMDSSYLFVSKVQDIVGRYGLTTSLYTSEGMDKSIMSSGAAKYLGVGGADGVLVMDVEQLENATQSNYTLFRSPARPLATLDAAPALSMSKFTTTSGPFLTSIPGAFKLLNASRNGVLDGTVSSIQLRVKRASDYQRIGDLLVGLLALSGRSATSSNVQEQLADMKTAGNLLNLFFIAAAFMILIICFFSLMSSMTTNVLDSAKEIGVLLCLGMSHFQIYRAYIWEAFVLVLAAGFMGLLVGLVVAYTMQLQNVLFTQLTLPFPFPYTQFCIVVVVGFVSAVASSVFPVAFLLSRPSITHILRRTIS